MYGFANADLARPRKIMNMTEISGLLPGRGLDYFSVEVKMVMHGLVLNLPLLLGLLVGVATVPCEPAGSRKVLHVKRKEEQ